MKFLCHPIAVNFLEAVFTVHIGAAVVNKAFAKVYCKQNSFTQKVNKSHLKIYFSSTQTYQTAITYSLAVPSAVFVKVQCACYSVLENPIPCMSTSE